MAGGDTMPPPGGKAGAPSPPKGAVNPRKMMGVQPGFSMLDWNVLNSKATNLSGRPGGAAARPRKIKMSEVKQHTSVHDSWTVFKGQVYNLTPFIHYHPGGIKTAQMAAGIDCTELFNKYHPWVNGGQMLANLVLGQFDPADDDDDDEDGDGDSSRGGEERQNGKGKGNGAGGGKSPKEEQQQQQQQQQPQQQQQQQKQQQQKQEEKGGSKMLSPPPREGGNGAAAVDTAVGGGRKGGARTAQEEALRILSMDASAWCEESMAEAAGSAIGGGLAGPGASSGSASGSSS